MKRSKNRPAWYLKRYDKRLFFSDDLFMRGVGILPIWRNLHNTYDTLKGAHVYVHKARNTFTFFTIKKDLFRLFVLGDFFLFGLFHFQKVIQCEQLRQFINQTVVISINAMK